MNSHKFMNSISHPGDCAIMSCRRPEPDPIHQVNAEKNSPGRGQGSARIAHPAFTPGPWVFNQSCGFIFANGIIVAQTWGKQEEDFENAAANGEFIARACNSHEAMKTQLQNIRAWLHVRNLDGTEFTAWPERVAAIDAALLLALEPDTKQ